jgi:hypothetical protein
MPSGNTSANVSANGRGVLRLVGSAFGFFAWAAHFLAVYIAQAVACQLSVVSVMSPGAVFRGSLATVTVLVAVVVAGHAWHTWQQHAEGDDAFLARIGIGQDAIATIAIAWQLIPIFTVPLCR